ncbi:MAG TPA: CehA/McbA family metallohydrolase [Pyrinomonadaceae bacterium]|nr:CehA/McbA family metallohydrolase [Pyrinomonadaceae bacterium]
MLKATRVTIYALCLLGATIPSRAQPEANLQVRTIDRVVHINPPGPNDSRYAYVPFDVPQNAARIKVSYRYDRATDTNTIDIGLFDSRFSGSDTDPRGFRGWSGGRRSEFFVSREEATPGYLRGELPAGKWRVILGLYRVGPAGVDISLKIEIETRTGSPKSASVSSGASEGATGASAPALVENQALRPAPVDRKSAGPGRRWWRGDLHMHTVHSDGNWTIAGLISSARSSGLDFIAIVDHNTASHHEEINRLSKGSRQLLVMRGEEITTYGGHTNAWGLPSGTWIDFRTHPGDSSRISEIAHNAHRAGALISINHPFALCGGCGWSYDATARDFDAIEVWNGSWDFTDEPAVKMWDQILQSGRRITAIASTDSHRPDTPLGKPSTHVAAKTLTQPAVLAAIRDGHVYLTDGTPGLAVRFAAALTTGRPGMRWMIGDEIRLKGPGKIRFFITVENAPAGSRVSLISKGEVIRTFPIGTGGQPQEVEVECGEASYFRLEVRDRKNTMIGMTNAIYVRLHRR